MKFFIVPFILIISFSYAERSPVERAGDIIQLAIPISGIGYTYYIDDNDGRKQFWKSYIYSLSTTYFLKAYTKETRPNGHCCESFPSGHTASAFAGAMFIQKRYGSKFGIPSLLLASFVGYSRVNAEKHYWRDVIAGATISIISTNIFTDQIDNYRTHLSYSPYLNQINLYISFK